MVFQDAINRVSTSGFWAYPIGHDIILFAIAPTTTLITLLRRKQFVLQVMAAPTPPVNALPQQCIYKLLTPTIHRLHCCKSARQLAR
ncbi:hypothetical protein [Nostoc sp.]|uniref:hypothetical protein n=1 Tax=Nostoc sp. TaxID=1180 RepID=UPI002FF5434C